MPHRRAQEKVKWNPRLNGLGFPFDEEKYLFGLLLSLSKKSKWPIQIILAPLKINNLQAAENHKMSRFNVFR